MASIMLMVIQIIEPVTTATNDKLTILNCVDVINKLSTTLIAAISAIYVYLQYRRAQRWKAADLAASLLQRLESDQELALSCHALDWGVGPLLIPEKYRPLFPRDQSGEHAAVMDHDPKVLIQALQPNLRKSTLKEPRGLVYRFCFIKLFDHLQNLSRLLKDGQVCDKDVVDIIYWLECLKDYKYAPPGEDGKRVFQPALTAWGYNGVLEIGERLGVPIAP